MKKNSEAVLSLVLIIASRAMTVSARHDRRSGHRRLPRDNGKGSDNGLSVSVSIGTANGHTNMTPNGIKAGLSAGDAYDFVKDHIGWWYGEAEILEL